MSAAELTQLASTVFAALAAMGSAGAAWVLYRQWAASSTPALSVDMAETQPQGILTLTIVNYGGPAKKVSFAVVEGEQSCLGFLPPHAFLAAAETASLRLKLERSGQHNAVAVVYGFDVQSRYVYAWAAGGRSERWPARSGRLRRRPTDLTAVQILQQFYPDAPDPTKLRQCTFELLGRGADRDRVAGA